MDTLPTMKRLLDSALPLDAEGGCVPPSARTPLGQRKDPNLDDAAAVLDRGTA
jgi:hypothetical protein